jgi:hypothetical protein
VLLRLACLGVANVFALLWLLPRSDRDKDAVILALRHRLAVLQRQLGSGGVGFAPSDRALLAALLGRLPRRVFKGLHLVVRADTVLRWHRDLMARRHAERSRAERVGGRVPCARSAPWSWGWCRKARSGDIGACTVNCWCWV